MRHAVIALLVACSHPKPAPVMGSRGVAPAADARPSQVAVKRDLWPVPMRVMGWTPDGLVQLGELPDHPPQTLPAKWYVEPTQLVDQAKLVKIVKAVREEHVPGLSLRGQPVGPWLGELRDLPELTALILSDTTIDSSELSAIDLTLERLYLARTQIDDTWATSLAGKLDKLAVLDVEDCSITDRGLAAITALGELRALNVAGTRITDKGGATLGKLGKLGILDLGGTLIGAQTIAAIRPLALTELFIDRTRVGKEIATLGGYAPGIVRFDASALVAYKATDADLAWLGQAPHLIEAGLSGTKLHDPLALQIAAHREMRILRLAGTEVTAPTIDAISKLDKLEEVDLAQLPVTDTQAIALIGMRHMKTLRLDGTQITDQALSGPVSPLLTELYLSKTKVTDKGLAILDGLPRLEGLGLGETDIKDATLVRIGKLGELHTLVLSKTKASRQALANLATLVKLERLYLDDTSADDDTIAGLARADLHALHLAGTDVSELALPTLRGFVHLDELTIGDTRVGSAISTLDAWRHLRTLSVVGLQLTDGSLLSIARRPSLVTLDLSATDVTDPSPLTALPSLRTLGLSNLKISASGETTVKALAAHGVDIVR